MLYWRLDVTLASEAFVLILNTGVHKDSDVVDQSPGSERLYLCVYTPDWQITYGILLYLSDKWRLLVLSDESSVNTSLLFCCQGAST